MEQANPGPDSLSQDGYSIPPAQILIVDDDEFVRDIIARKLRSQNYLCRTCDCGEAALVLLAENEYDLLVTDVNMPGMGGIELVKHAQASYPALAIILVTSFTDLGFAVRSLKEGAYDFVGKPFSLEEVTIAATRALEKRRLVLDNQRYRRLLEDQVARRSEQLKNAMDVIQATYHSTLIALGTALDSRDADTGLHSLRVTMFSGRIAREMALDAEILRNIEQGALLHDIGKIGIPDGLLRKPGKLTAEEWILMRKHPEIGHRILSGVKFLQGAALMVLHHQERFDGSGYPCGLSGAEINLGARIFAVADTLDSMTSDRPFQRASSFEDAREEILRLSGTKFDPEVVQAFAKVPLTEWGAIRNSAGMKSP
jgi:putative two-component system response regulator